LQHIVMGTVAYDKVRRIDAASCIGSWYKHSRTVYTFPSVYALTWSVTALGSFMLPTYSPPSAYSAAPPNVHNTATTRACVLPLVPPVLHIRTTYRLPAATVCADVTRTWTCGIRRRHDGRVWFPIVVGRLSLYDHGATPTIPNNARSP